METYYILIVGVLFLLAISDLIVGVSNDAVNFLNSAIGSKAAPFKIILAIRVEKLPQRGWVTFSGILSLVLAIYIGSQFPTSALWVIGMLFGIEMMFSGWAFVMIAMAARRRKEETPPPAVEVSQAGEATAG